MEFFLEVFLCFVKGCFECFLCFMFDIANGVFFERFKGFELFNEMFMLF